MNKELQEYARTQLKQRLAKCTDDQQLFFKRMYANKKLETPIDIVVDNMPEDKLDWAMQQVSATLRKSNK